jgi:hypothetical protein
LQDKKIRTLGNQGGQGTKHNIKDGDESKTFHLNLKAITTFFNL